MQMQMDLRLLQNLQRVRLHKKTGCRISENPARRAHPRVCSFGYKRDVDNDQTEVFMVRKFVFGEPIETEAVIDQVGIEVLQGGTSFPDQWQVVQAETLTLTHCMEPGERIYGLGESMRGINKRGFRYVSWNTDDPIHTEDKESLYGAHNFLVIQGGVCQGLFVDDPGRVSFDIGFTVLDRLEIRVDSGSANLYVIDGEDILDIVRQFRRIIGRSYIPPLWGMGYGQSRWSYPDVESVREVLRRHRENHIPLDAIYLDIDYMEKYMDFTVSEERFPEFAVIVSEMKQQGIHLVPIIDAGVKMEPGYRTYEEGLEKGYFCRKEDGNELVVGVWPGKTHFPDVLNPEAREWFGNSYQPLMDQGIDGFWNDMNEPAIFYTEDRLLDTFDQLKSFRNTDMDLQEFWRFVGLGPALQNNQEDYTLFYHNMNGTLVRHDRVHNLYGYNMTRAAGEAFDRLRPDQRILLFSRSSYVGMHRYGGIWTGDNQSWWSHILLSMYQMVGLNMCGFLFVGSDIGGFGSNASEDLVIRFTEWGLFTPLMRNHSSLGTVCQEGYAFSRPEIFAHIIGLRYLFLPYLYSEFMRAALQGEMYFYPLAFLYPGDEMACRVEDQLFVGQSMMIAPVYEQNARGRYVYLPEPMKLYRFRSVHEYDTEMLSQGHHYVNCELEEVLVFVRQNGMIPCTWFAEGEQPVNIDSVLKADSLCLMCYASEPIRYTLYRDNGLDKDYTAPGKWVSIETDEDGQVHVSDGNTKILHLI